MRPELRPRWRRSERPIQNPPLSPTTPATTAGSRPARSDAALETAGTFVDCYRSRADILDGRGDWVRAQKAYADAVALAPDLPAAYYSWGVALMKRGGLGDDGGGVEKA